MGGFTSKPCLLASHFDSPTGEKVLVQLLDSLKLNTIQPAMGPEPIREQ